MGADRDTVSGCGPSRLFGRAAWNHRDQATPDTGRAEREPPEAGLVNSSRPVGMT